MRQRRFSNSLVQCPEYKVRIIFLHFFWTFYSKGHWHNNIPSVVFKFEVLSRSCCKCYKNFKFTTTSGVFETVRYFTAPSKAPGVVDFKYSKVALAWATTAANACGWLIARSTLNRNGIFITSGLYDSGFENYIGGVMHVRCGPATIEKGARIAQFIFVEAETVRMYDGEYNVI